MKKITILLLLATIVSCKKKKQDPVLTNELTPVTVTSKTITISHFLAGGTSTAYPTQIFFTLNFDAVSQTNTIQVQSSINPSVYTGTIPLTADSISYYYPPGTTGYYPKFTVSIDGVQKINKTDNSFGGWLKY